MKLILIRHGEAETPIAMLDHERALTKLGQMQAQSTAKQVIEKYKPDLLIMSPLKRAQQTAAALLDLSTDIPSQVYDGVKPDDDAQAALKWLSQFDQIDTVVVVCHMNVIASLTQLLTADHFQSYALAEARVLEQVAIHHGESVVIESFLPTSSDE